MGTVLAPHIEKARRDLHGLPRIEREQAAEKAMRRLVVAEGLLMSWDDGDDRRVDAARKLLGQPGLPSTEAAEALKRDVEQSTFVVESVFPRLRSKKGTFHGMHGVERAARRGTMVQGPPPDTCKECGSLKSSPESSCPNCGADPDLVTGGEPGDVLPDVSGMRERMAESATPAILAGLGRPVLGTGNLSGLKRAVMSFDPGKHPRDRMGRWLEAIAHGEHVRYGEPMGGVTIHKERRLGGTRYVLRNRSPFGSTRGRVAAHKTPSGALVAADALYRRNTSAVMSAPRMIREALLVVEAGAVEPQPPTAVAWDEQKHPRAAGGKFGAKGGGGQPNVVARGHGMGPEGPHPVVAQLQARLNELGANVGTSGQFGTETQAALKDFQRAQGLKASGKVDPETVDALRNPVAAEDAADEAKVPAQIRAQAASATAQAGGAGNVQAQLAAIGYDVGPGKAGTVGAGTVAAVKAFQKDNGLPVTGNADARTAAMIAAVARDPKASQGLVGLSAGKRPSGAPTATPSPRGNAAGKGRYAAGRPQSRAARSAAQARGGTAMRQSDEVREATVYDGTPVPYGGVPQGPVTVVGNGKMIPANRDDLRDLEDANRDGDDFLYVREPSLPPALREGQGFTQCASCVHYSGQGRCNKYAWRVDADDLCDSWFTLTEEAARPYVLLAEAKRQAAELAAAGETRRATLARARVAFYAERVMEASFTEQEREKLAAKGHAMPGGGFPIRNRGDLENAVQALGRAKDKARAKAHIVKRAKALGATDALPDGWLQEAPVGRADDPNKTMPRKLRGKMTEGGHVAGTMVRLSEAPSVDSSALPPLEKKPGGPDNWVEKNGVRQSAKYGGGKGLPNLIEGIARHIRAQGRGDVSSSIAQAVSQVKKWCATGTTFGGRVKLGTKARARACEAVAQWERMKAKSHAQEAEMIDRLSARLVLHEAATMDGGVSEEERAPWEPSLGELRDLFGDLAEAVTVSEAYLSESAVGAVFEEGKHPRGRGGKFAEVHGMLGSIKPGYSRRTKHGLISRGIPAMRGQPDESHIFAVQHGARVTFHGTQEEVATHLSEPQPKPRRTSAYARGVRASAGDFIESSPAQTKAARDTIERLGIPSRDEMQRDGTRRLEFRIGTRTLVRHIGQNGRITDPNFRVRETEQTVGGQRHEARLHAKLTEAKEDAKTAHVAGDGRAYSAARARIEAIERRLSQV